MDTSKKVIGYVVGFLIASGVIYVIRGGDKLKPFELYRSEEGRFSVLFPGEPKKNIKLLNTIAGKIDLVMYTAGSKKSGFVVGYADYPEEAVKDPEPQKMLDGARDGALSNVRGELVDETVLDFQGYPARELEIDVPRRGTVRARLIIVGNRLYQMMVISPSDNILYEKGTEFFDSFEITETE